jgi:hypothetical protein
MVRVASATIAAALLAALPLLAAATAKARPPLPLAPTCDTYTFSATEIDLIEDPFTRALVVFTAGDNATGRGYYIDPGTGGRRHEGSFTGGIKGRTIDISAKWDVNGATSHYTGQVNDDGSVTGTVTNGAVGNDWQNDRWHSGLHWLTCVNKVDPGPPILMSSLLAVATARSRLLGQSGSRGRGRNIPSRSLPLTGLLERPRRLWRAARRGERLAGVGRAAQDVAALQWTMASCDGTSLDSSRGCGTDV